MISLGTEQVFGSSSKRPGDQREASKREEASTAAEKEPQVEEDCEAWKGELCPKEQGGQQEDIWISPCE
jgi:hypothetical protein